MVIKRTKFQYGEKEKENNIIFEILLKGNKSYESFEFSKVKN